MIAKKSLKPANETLVQDLPPEQNPKGGGIAIEECGARRFDVAPTNNSSQESCAKFLARSWGSALDDRFLKRIQHD
jgi:hypothetical protein